MMKIKLLYIIKKNKKIIYIYIYIYIYSHDKLFHEAVNINERKL